MKLSWLRKIREPQLFQFIRVVGDESLVIKSVLFDKVNIALDFSLTVD